VIKQNALQPFTKAPKIKHIFAPKRKLEDECFEDLSLTDSWGADCTYYDYFPSECGLYDTDDFIANVTCCACGGGSDINPIIQECDDTKALVKDRLTCYTDAEQDKVVGYCDTKVLTSTDEPTAAKFFECYNSIKIDTTDLSLCDNLFPLANTEIGGSFNLLSCYETFGISITVDNMHEKCTGIYKDNMYYSINEYHTCLNDLGSSITADRCYIDPYIN
jgi:hypothetical protein